MAPEKLQGQQAQSNKSNGKPVAPEKAPKGQQAQSNNNARSKAPEKAQGQQAPKPQKNAQPKAPKKSEEQQAQEDRNNQAQALSKEQQDREAAQAAQKAMYYKQRAHEYAEAAAGCADPDERQKLMEMKIEEYIKAEKFGKTARYMQKGSFQGFAAGSGLGVGLGVTLGTLTGTLVGGPTSLLTGGIGAIAGAAHGPFFNLASLSGSVIRKITGDLPGWKATTQQKRALEKMCGQINEMDEPTAEELKGIAGDNVGEINAAVSSAKPSEGSSWGQTAASWIPGASNMPSSWGGSGEKQETNVDKQRKLNAAKQDQEAKSSLQDASATKPQVEGQQAQAKQAPKLAQSNGHGSAPEHTDKAPREGRSNPNQSQTQKAQAQTEQPTASQNARPGPRKLGKSSTSTQDTPSTPRSKPNDTTPAGQNAQKPSGKPLTSANCQASKASPSGPTKDDKKKPRKLEPRSTNRPQASTQNAASKGQESSPPAKRRSPRKLESRSQA